MIDRVLVIWLDFGVVLVLSMLETKCVVGNFEMLMTDFE